MKTTKRRNSPKALNSVVGLAFVSETILAERARLNIATLMNLRQMGEGLVTLSKKHSDACRWLFTNRVRRLWKSGFRMNFESTQFAARHVRKYQVSSGMMKKKKM